MSETTPSRFIDPYLEYAGSLTDAPRTYHEVCAYAAVGLAVARAWGLAWAGQVLYPLVWAVLVGPPSSRKTTALAIMKRILRLAYPERVCPDSVTPSSLMEELGEQPVQGLVMSEMLSLLGAMRQKFMEGAEGQLMELFDTPPVLVRRRVKDGGRVSVKDPGLMILGGMTPDGFQRYARADDFGIGFLARFIFVVGGRPAVEKPVPPGADVEREATLAGVLRKIGDEAIKLGGVTARLSPEAAAAYGAWSTAHMRWVDELTDGFQSCGVKAGVLPLRIAVARQADRGRMGRTIEGEAVQAGCHFTDRVRDGIEAMAPDLVASPNAKTARRLLRVFRKFNGRANRKMLMQFGGLDREELTRALQNLKDAGMIVREPESEHQKGEWWSVVREPRGEGG